MSFLNQVCNALADAGVRYAIVGGHAVALHGAVRGTVDVDIAVQWTLPALRDAERALREIGLESRLPVDAEAVFRFRDEYVENRNLIGWNFFDPANPLQQVDIVITYDLKGQRVVTFDTGGGKVRVLSRPALIAMKEASGRPQDIEDVRALKSLQ